MIEKRWLRSAIRGSNSVKNSPGVRVAMAWNGPRYSSGASGLGSHVSRWLGPPHRKTKSTDFTRGGRRSAARPAAPPSPSPRGTDPARRKKDRRPIVPQVRVGKLPISSIRRLTLADSQGLDTVYRIDGDCTARDDDFVIVSVRRCQS